MFPIRQIPQETDARGAAEGCVENVITPTLVNGPFGIEHEPGVQQFRNSWLTGGPEELSSRPELLIPKGREAEWRDLLFLSATAIRQFARGYNRERRWWGEIEMKIRPLLIMLSLSLQLAASAQEQCPQFSGPARVRLEQQARWLVSDSLQKQILARSSAFGQLIAFERCHILQSNLLSDQITEEEGPFFVADNVPLKSRVGRYQRTWMMVIAPTEATGRLPNAKNSHRGRNRR